MQNQLPEDIAAAFAGVPSGPRKTLLAMRRLIFSVAADNEGVGTVVESLKWGQPSYHTVRPKSGSPIRLGLSKDLRPALFCHCQTSLVAEFRDQFGQDFDFEGNRALVLKGYEVRADSPLHHCLTRALTYHASNRR